MADYLPNDEPSFIIWLGNYQAKLADHGAPVGLLPADVTALSTACNDLAAKINAVQAAKAALKNAVEANDAAKLTNIVFIRSQNSWIRTHSAYTDAIGDDLGIKGNGEAIDEENVKPKLTGESFPGYVKLKFTKKGLDGVNMYKRLKGQGAWAFLARDTNSPYNDARPLSQPGAAETREYMAIGVIDDAQVSQQSDIVTVVFGG